MCAPRELVLESSWYLRGLTWGPGPAITFWLSWTDRRSFVVIF